MAELLTDNQPNGVRCQDYGTMLAPGLQQHLEHNILTDIIKIIRIGKTVSQNGRFPSRKHIPVKIPMDINS
jgi:hypothetical protein